MPLHKPRQNELSRFEDTSILRTTLIDSRRFMVQIVPFILTLRERALFYGTTHSVYLDLKGPCAVLRYYPFLLSLP